MMNPNLKSDGITRRDAIKVGLAGAASLALGDPTQLLAATTRAALPATPSPLPGA
jgi:hypothetical protein